MTTRTMCVVLPDLPRPAITGYHLRMLSTLAVAQGLGWETIGAWFGDPRDSTPELPGVDELVHIGPRRHDRHVPSRVAERARWLAASLVGRSTGSYPFSTPFEDGRERVLQLARDRAGAVLLPTFLAHWAPALGAGTTMVIGDAVDILTDLSAKLLRTEGRKRPARAAGLLINHLACRSQERTFLPAFDEVWVTSEGEGPRARSLGARRTVVVPSTFGVDVPATVVDADPGAVGFIGNLAMPPNLDAAVFLVHEVMPLLRTLVPEAELRIAGVGLPDEVHRRFESIDGVQVLGAVPDAAAFVTSCAVAALPIRVRGGVPLKLFEAMHLGRPVVATPELIAGLPIRPGIDVLVADDAAEFARSIALLLGDATIALTQANAARSTFDRNFSLEAAIVRARAESVAAAP